MSAGDIHILTTRVNRDKGWTFFEEREPLEGTIFEDTPPDKLAGEIYRFCLREYGRCTGKIYVDQRIRTNDHGGERWEVVHVGWCFEKREEYDDYRSRETYLCETWVALERVVREPETIPGQVESFAVSAA